MVEQLGNPNSTSYGEEYDSVESRGEDRGASINSSILLRHAGGGYPSTRSQGRKAERWSHVIRDGRREAQAAVEE